MSDETRAPAMVCVGPVAATGAGIEVLAA
jgi:hypothetical protein